MFKTLLRVGICATLLACLSQQAVAQYPDRPVAIVVPFGAGGPSDTITRILAEELQRQLGATFIVENKPGAGGLIGTQHLVKAAPDGYTIGLAVNTNMVTSIALKDNPPHEATDLDMIGCFAEFPLVLVGPPSEKFSSLKDLLKAAKDAPGKLNWASTSMSTQMFAGLDFLSAAGLSAVNVPFGGAENAVITSLLLTEKPSDFAVVLGPSVMGPKVKVLGIFGEKQSSFFPGVPTLAEGGVKNLGKRSPIFFALAAPRGTPQAIKDKLLKALEVAQQNPEIIKRLAPFATTPLKCGSTALAEMIALDRSMVEKTMAENGIKRQ
ncbi:tripartite tricarboxylate transporter substrate binding protein [Candidatus Kaiserbacteria bacterium]|nr:tripartite tricarboxylate transporter substrate binding protein [Candidatus Kaiserbacteria bacterium]